MMGSDYRGRVPEPPCCSEWWRFGRDAASQLQPQQPHLLPDQQLMNAHRVGSFSFLPHHCLLALLSLGLTLEILSFFLPLHTAFAQGPQGSHGGGLSAASIFPGWHPADVSSLVLPSGPVGPMWVPCGFLVIFTVARAPLLSSEDGGPNLVLAMGQLAHLHGCLGGDRPPSKGRSDRKRTRKGCLALTTLALKTALCLSITRVIRV